MHRPLHVGWYMWLHSDFKISKQLDLNLLATSAATELKTSLNNSVFQVLLTLSKFSSILLLKIGIKPDHMSDI